MASLRGQIVEFYTGRGVPGVLVTLGAATAVTDQNGNFTFALVPSGSYTLQAIHRDFQTYATVLSLPQNLAYTLPAPIRVMSVVRAL